MRVYVRTYVRGLALTRARKLASTANYCSNGDYRFIAVPVLLSVALHQAIINMPALVLLTLGLLLFLTIICVIYFNCRAWRNIREDKKKATEKRFWERTPENTLLDDAFLGGIGGLLAMEWFHHKTAPDKSDFRRKYQYRCLCGSILQLIVIAVLIMSIFIAWH